VHPCTRMCSLEGQNAIPYKVWRLGFEMHIPILGARDTLFQILGTRGGVRLGMAWQNERREFEGQELFGFSAGDGVAIEQGVARHRHEGQIAVHVLLHKLLREPGIMGEDSGLRSALSDLRKTALGASQFHHGLQAVFLDVLPVRSKMAMRCEPTLHTSGRLRQH
jgi:hypothetical protein